MPVLRIGCGGPLPPGTPVSATLAIWCAYIPGPGQPVLGGRGPGVSTSTDNGGSWQGGNGTGGSIGALGFPTAPFNKQLVVDNYPQVLPGDFPARCKLRFYCVGTVFANGVRDQFEVWNVVLSITDSFGVITNWRATSAVIAVNGTNSGVDDLPNAIDIDTNPPVTFADVWRSLFSGTSNSSIMELSTWVQI